MKRLCVIFLTILLFVICLGACDAVHTPKIGVAFGVGPALRWPQEIQDMKDYADTLGIELEARLNTDEAAKPLAQDCYELIDSGVDVLIIRPRDVFNMSDVIDYAHENKVKVISYDSLIENAPVDLFIGYDALHTGENLGRYLSELVPYGDYILLWGDRNRNVDEMYAGAMNYLEPLEGQINILLETGVPGWSAEEAKKLVKEAVTANGNNVDAIFAFNDILAGAGADALSELGIEKNVVIVGMDAELDAVRRIVKGSQSCTAYMDTKELAYVAVDQAVNFANNKKVEKNSEMDNGSSKPVYSYLITRQLVIRENITRILIDSGHFTEQQVYGEE